MKTILAILGGTLLAGLVISALALVYMYFTFCGGRSPVC